METQRFLPDNPTFNQIQAFLYGDGIIRYRMGGIRWRHLPTYNHLTRSAYIATRIAQDSRQFSPPEIVEVATAAELHDIGKDLVDKKILDEPRELTPDEHLEVQQHPEIGAKLLTDLLKVGVPTLITPHVLLMVEYHHSLQGNVGGKHGSYPIKIDPEKPETDPDGFPQGEERGRLLQKLYVVVAADLGDAGFMDRDYHNAQLRSLSEVEVTAKRVKLYGEMGKTYPGPQLFYDLAVHYAALVRGQRPQGPSRN